MSTELNQESTNLTFQFESEALLRAYSRRHITQFETSELSAGGVNQHCLVAISIYELPSPNRFFAQS